MHVFTIFQTRQISQDSILAVVKLVKKKKKLGPYY